MSKKVLQLKNILVLCYFGDNKFLLYVAFFIFFDVMSETHIIEYKSNRRDEYLKWICAFANTQG
jgi:hypothetical protein